VILDAGAVQPLLKTFTMGIPEVEAARRDPSRLQRSGSLELFEGLDPFEDSNADSPSRYLQVRVGPPGSVCVCVRARARAALVTGETGGSLAGGRWGGGGGFDLAGRLMQGCWGARASIGYTWSYMVCRIGHWVPIWQALRDSTAQGYYCGPEHERLASAAAAAALAALSQNCAATCAAISEAPDSASLLAYPLAVGCFSVVALRQETEAVLQVCAPSR
jgi:hypothetical protein